MSLQERSSLSSLLFDLSIFLPYSPSTSTILDFSHTHTQATMSDDESSDHISSDGCLSNDQCVPRSTQNDGKNCVDCKKPSPSREASSSQPLLLDSTTSAPPPAYGSVVEPPTQTHASHLHHCHCCPDLESHDIDGPHSRRSPTAIEKIIFSIFTLAFVVFMAMVLYHAVPGMIRQSGLRRT